VINTHFPAHALRVADKVLLLGHDNYCSMTRQVINSRNIQEYFGVQAQIVYAEASDGEVPGIVPVCISEKQALTEWKPEYTTEKKEQIHGKKAV
jgi:iron complex transport system ATP-binding protein